MTNSLELISKASQMLVEATTIQKAKELKDLALTAMDFAKRKDMGEETIQYARSYAFEAEKRMGELLEATERARPAIGSKIIGSKRIPMKEQERPTLSDLGITKKGSSDAQFLSSLPEEEFEKVKSGEKKVSVIKRERKAKQREQAKKDTIEAQKPKGYTPKAELADAVDWLMRQDQADLILTDPPYSTDIEDIASFAQSWLPIALSKLKSTGRAFIFIGAYSNELLAYLSVALPEQILAWTYRNTLGPTPIYNYKLNWQAILYFTEKEAPKLNCPEMTEQFSVQDINAPDGRLGDRYHTWQKPDEIAERFIRHSTKEGNLVLDPFVGTGTFILEATKQNRIGLGCDTNKDMLKIAKERGCELTDDI